MPDKNNLIEKFVKSHINDIGILGILLCGSYSYGNSTPNSDVDIRIIYSDEIKINEKRVQIIDKIVFSSFLRNESSYINLMNNQFQNISKFEARNISTCKVLYSTDSNKVNRILELAKNIMKIEFSTLSKKRIDILKYSLWNHYTKICNLPEKSLLFAYNYYILANRILSIYGNILGFEYVLEDKIEDYLTSKDFREMYYMQDIPDKKFKKLFLITVTNMQKENIINLYEHVEKQVGKLNLNNLIIAH